MRAAELVHAYVTGEDKKQREERERLERGVTFREVAPPTPTSHGWRG